jgi:queuosine biosynthesis protein QueC
VTRRTDFATLRCYLASPGNQLQAHMAERGAATALASWFGIEIEFREVRLWGHATEGPCIVPGRNAVLLSLAGALAQAQGHGSVVIGCNADDQADYPDCRPGFLRAMQEALGSVVRAPLIGMTKREVARYARDLGVPVEATWSCYQPRDGGPCGVCAACRLRDDALTTP